MAAVRSRWEEERETLPALFSEPPQSGRLQSPQPDLYALLECQLEKRESAGTGGAFYDWRRVSICVYGRKDDVRAGLSAVGAIFNRNTTLTFPTTDAETGKPKFLRWWPADGGGDTLEQDPERKSGEDIWVGKVASIVWALRLE